MSWKKEWKKIKKNWFYPWQSKMPPVPLYLTGETKNICPVTYLGWRGTLRGLIGVKLRNQGKAARQEPGSHGGSQKCFLNQQRQLCWSGKRELGTETGERGAFTKGEKRIEGFEMKFGEERRKGKRRKGNPLFFFGGNVFDISQTDSLADAKEKAVASLLEPQEAQ